MLEDTKSANNGEYNSLINEGATVQIVRPYDEAIHMARVRADIKKKYFIFMASQFMGDEIVNDIKLNVGGVLLEMGIATEVAESCSRLVSFPKGPESLDMK